MAITVNIPGTATATIDESNNITVLLQVQILNSTTIIGDTVLSINIYLYTANILAYAVSQMIEKINQYKALCIKHNNIQAALANFTNQVKAGV